MRRPTPNLLCRNARNSAARGVARRTCQPAKVRFIRLRQRPGGILDAFRPQEGEYRPRSITVPGIWGQNERGDTQTLGGWTREWVTRGRKGRGCVGNQLAGRSGREAKRAAAPGLGGSCGAQPRTHLRHEALDLECPLDRALDARAPTPGAPPPTFGHFGTSALSGRDHPPCFERVQIGRSIGPAGLERCRRGIALLENGLSAPHERPFSRKPS